MAAAFTMVTQNPEPMWLMADGQRAASAESYRGQAAEDAFTRTVGRAWYEQCPRAYGVLRNLTRFHMHSGESTAARAAGMRAAAAVLDGWQLAVAQVQAVPGPVGYRAGPAGQHKLLRTSDGQEHHTREHCYSHMLEMDLLELRPRLSQWTVRALCNVSVYSRDAVTIGRETSQLRYLLAWRRLWADSMAGPVEPAKVALVAKALHAAVEALTMSAEMAG